MSPRNDPNLLFEELVGGTALGIWAGTTLGRFVLPIEIWGLLVLLAVVAPVAFEFVVRARDPKDCIICALLLLLFGFGFATAFHQAPSGRIHQNQQWDMTWLAYAPLGLFAYLTIMAVVKLKLHRLGLLT
jgi:hypothetical protein